MAYKRGLLTGPDLNELQERLLMAILIQEKVEKFKDTEAAFERQIMIHRPDVWEKLLEKRKEDEALGFDHIEDKVPETPAEVAAIDRAFEEMLSNIDTSEMGE